jgi:hypothetical protein
MSDLAHAAHAAAKSNDQPAPEDLYIYILICMTGVYPYNNDKETAECTLMYASTLELAKSMLDKKDSKDELGWQLIDDRWRFTCKDGSLRAHLNLDPEQITQNVCEYTAFGYRIEKIYVHQPKVSN